MKTARGTSLIREIKFADATKVPTLTNKIPCFFLSLAPPKKQLKFHSTTKHEHILPPIPSKTAITNAMEPGEITSFHCWNVPQGQTGAAASSHNLSKIIISFFWFRTKFAIRCLGKYTSKFYVLVTQCHP